MLSDVRSSAQRRNNVNELGTPDGRPILFAHGLSCSQGMWRHVTPEFVDHRIVLFVIMGNSNRPHLGPHLGAELTESFCRTDPAIARHFAAVTFLSDNRRDLPHVTTPTLVVHAVTMRSHPCAWART